MWFLNIFKRKPQKYVDSKAFTQVKSFLKKETYPIEFNKEYKIKNVDGFNVTCEVDIYLPHVKIGIEIDGEHHLDLKRIDKDNHKDMQLFVLYNIKVFRITTNRSRNRKYLLEQIRDIEHSATGTAKIVDSVLQEIKNKMKGY